jgi:hypothetical protein
MCKKFLALSKKPLGEAKSRSDATLSAIEPRQDAVPIAQDIRELIMKPFDKISTANAAHRNNRTGTASNP